MVIFNPQKPLWWHRNSQRQTWRSACWKGKETHESRCEKDYICLSAAQVYSEAMPVDILGSSRILNIPVIRELVHRGDNLREIISLCSHVPDLFKYKRSASGPFDDSHITSCDESCVPECWEENKVPICQIWPDPFSEKFSLNSWHYWLRWI